MNWNAGRWFASSWFATHWIAGQNVVVSSAYFPEMIGMVYKKDQFDQNELTILMAWTAQKTVLGL